MHLAAVGCPAQLRLEPVEGVLEGHRLVIGGGLGSAGPAFIDGVRASVHRFAQAPLASVCDVQPAQLGQRAELLGALALAGTLVSR